MPAILLTPAQRKAHRADAHHLDPVVMVGGEGLTDAVVGETDRALSAHGLIKLRVLAAEREERQAMLSDLAERLNAAPIQHIGRLLVLWRPKPEAPPAPKEPKAKAAHGGSKVVKIVKHTRPGARPEIKHLTVHGNQRVTPGGIVKREKRRVSSIKKRAQG